MTDHYQAIVENEARNALICEDIKSAVTEGRNPIVLSERVEHIKHLKELLEGTAQNIILISGQGTAKEKCETLEKLNAILQNESLVVLATGKYAGEGRERRRSRQNA